MKRNGIITFTISAGIFFGAASSLAATFKVTTENVFCLDDPTFHLAPIRKPNLESRLRLFPRRAAARGADVINFQEVWLPEMRAQLIKDMASYDYRYHTQLPMSPSVVNRATGCATFFAAASTGFIYNLARYPEYSTRRQFGVRAGKGLATLFGLAGTYVSAGTDHRWRVMNNGLITFSKHPIGRVLGTTFNAVAEWDEIFVNKGVVMAEILLPDGKTIWSANTHLPATNDFSKKETEARWKALRVLGKFLEENSRNGENVVLGGDLNFDYRKRLSKTEFDRRELSAEYRYLQTIMGIDSFHLLHGFDSNEMTDSPLNPTRMADNPREIPKFIDYLFAKGKNIGRVLNAKLILDGPATEEERRIFRLRENPQSTSDHLYVDAEYELIP